MIQIEGAISIKAAIESKQRKVEILYIDETKKTKDVGYILWLAKENHVQVKRLSKEALLDFNPLKTFGGILAQVSERFYQSVEDILDARFVVLIEGVEDPFNLGQMIRSAYASGAEAILLNQRDWSKVESILLKSSAGAFDRIHIVLLNDLAAELKQLKECGFKLVSALRNENSISMDDLNYPDKSILAIGGEMRGLSKAVKDASDIAVEIKYPNAAKVALSASSACAILCFKHVSKL